MRDNENLIDIPLDELSIGDKVAIQKNKTFDYHYYCEGWAIKIIERITPKKTKIIFTDGSEISTKYTLIFEVNNYITETERKARKRVFLCNLLLKYAQSSSFRRAVLALSEQELDHYIEIFTASEKAYEEIKGKEV